MPRTLRSRRRAIGADLFDEEFYADEVAGLEGSEMTGVVTVVTMAAIVTKGRGKENGNFITNNVFRWEKGSWGKQAPRWHFHAYPKMQHHLPHQFKTWFYRSHATLRKWMMSWK